MFNTVKQLRQTYVYAYFLTLRVKLSLLCSVMSLLCTKNYRNKPMGATNLWAVQTYGRYKPNAKYITNSFLIKIRNLSRVIQIVFDLHFYNIKNLCMDLLEQKTRDTLTFFNIFHLIHVYIVIG